MFIVCNGCVAFRELLPNVVDSTYGTVEKVPRRGKVCGLDGECVENSPETLHQSFS